SDLGSHRLKSPDARIESISPSGKRRRWSNSSRTASISGLRRRTASIRRSTSRGVVLVVNAPSMGLLPLRASGLRTEWLDVLVHAEEVLRIVLRLDLLQTSVVRPIGRWDGVASLVVVEIVDVSARPHEGLQTGIGIACPGDAVCVPSAIHPLRQHQ